MTSGDAAWTLDTALAALVETDGATDLFLVPGRPPALRVRGAVRPLELPPPSPDALPSAVRPFLDPEQQARLQQQKSVDGAFTDPAGRRFRFNLAQTQDGLAVSIRKLETVLPSLEQLGFAPELKRRLLTRKQGLILVSGPPSSGKTMTVAAMVDYLNATAPVRIITIEDPIEFLHPDRMGFVTQREVPAHTPAFVQALRDALRESPDVLVVGELREPEAVEVALQAAETGILVLTTLHTLGAVQAVSRLLAFFPDPAKQAAVRLQLSFALAGVVSQVLVPVREGLLKLCYEAFDATPAVRNLIRRGEEHTLSNQILLQGFRSIARRLEALVRQRALSREEARLYAPDPRELEDDAG